MNRMPSLRHVVAGLAAFHFAAAIAATWFAMFAVRVCTVAVTDCVNEWAPRAVALAIIAGVLWFAASVMPRTTQGVGR